MKKDISLPCDDSDKNYDFDANKEAQIIFFCFAVSSHCIKSLLLLFTEKMLSEKKLKRK